MSKKQPPIICRACPKCGATAAKQTHSRKLVSVSGDRICQRCQTQYTPPTPGWVFWSSLVMGLIFACSFVPVVVLMAIEKWSGRGQMQLHEAGDAWIDTPSSWVVLSCSGIAAIFGLLCLIHAWMVFREKPVEPPRQTAASAAADAE